MERCLYCYKELADGERDFHKSCSKKIFGTPQVPLLPYTRANIAELAREVIRSQTTLTGVQAKLSLDIAKEAKAPRNALRSSGCGAAISSNRRPNIIRICRNWKI